MVGVQQLGIEMVLKAGLGEEVGDRGALLVIAAATHTTPPAASSRWVISLTSWCSAPTTAADSAVASAWKSMSCHWVSVPPQSKMTASISTGPTVGPAVRALVERRSASAGSSVPGSLPLLAQRSGGARTAGGSERWAQEPVTTPAT